MINNILNHKLPKASFTKIINPNKSEIIFFPPEIQQTINNHFEKVFRSRTINLESWPDWINKYTPVTDINPSWYHPLTSPISEHEILQIIKDLPSDKAPGPSGITYNFLKNISKEITPLILPIFNQILIDGQIPTKWSYSNIFPISKKHT